MGDLAVEITATDKSLSECSLPVNVDFSADGQPCYIKLTLSQRFLLDYRAEITRDIEEMLDSKTASLLTPGAYPGWTFTDGIERFYIKADPQKIKDSLANVRTTSEILLLDEFQRITLKYTQPIKELITNQLVRYGLLPDDIRALSEALSNAIRLSILDWRKEVSHSLPWKSCVYIMRKTTGKSGSTGVGVLILLSKSDYDTWGGIQVSPSRLPLLVTAVEPFLNAIQEIENTALNRVDGERLQRDNFAHQTSCVVDSIVASVNRLPNQILRGMGETLVAQLHLLRATIYSYREPENRRDLGLFTYPWEKGENPLAVYRDIGIQLGLARCETAPYKEESVRIEGNHALLEENQIGKPGFDNYRKLFEEIPIPPREIWLHLQHSHFAVLILLTIKQAFYHTVRARLIGNNFNATISMAVCHFQNDLVFECTVTNPLVNGENPETNSKDFKELRDIALSLSGIPEHRYRYTIDGPNFIETDNCWKTTTCIHEN